MENFGISLWGKNGSYSNVSGSSTEWHIEMNGAARMPNMNVDYYTVKTKLGWI